MPSQPATFTCLAIEGTILTALIAGYILYILDALNGKIDFLFFTPKVVAQFISVGVAILSSFIGQKYLSFDEGIIHSCKTVLERSRHA